MSRPADWSPVGYGSDPVPGDPARVLTIGRMYVGTADAIDRAASNLTRALGDEFGRAESIDAIRGQAEEVARRIGMAEERYRGVGDAMIAYAAKLQAAQAESAAALSDAEAAEGSQSTANYWVRYYEDKIADPATPPANLPHLRSQLSTWETKQSAAQGGVSSAIARVATAVTNRDSAAEVAIADVRLVENSGDLNDGFWDDVSQWVAEHKDVLDIIGNILSGLAAIAVFVALLVPGLNLIALAIITINLVYTLANSALQVATGNMTTGEAILAVGMAALNFVGAGAIVKVAATGAKTATVTALRALPGATRGGSNRLVQAAMRSATTTTMPQKTLQALQVVGVDPRKWAQVHALSTLKLNGALVAPAAADTATRALAAVAGVNGITTIAGIALNGTMSDALPQPVLPWRLYGDPEVVGMGPGESVVVSHYGTW